MDCQDYAELKKITYRLARIEQKVDAILKLQMAQPDYPIRPSPIETEVIWNNN